MPSSPVIDQPVRYDRPTGEKPLRQRHVMYNIAALVLIAIVVSALLESLVHYPLFGISGRNVSASSPTTDLTVKYPRVIRGQLDTMLEITVQRGGGFQNPVTVEVSAAYLGLFTNQQVAPQPSDQTHDDQFVSSTFDPPHGDTLKIEWDLAARPRPWFASVVGSVVVLGDDQQPDVSVSFRTDVRP